jgi:hypothetical protein
LPAVGGQVLCALAGSGVACLTHAVQRRLAQLPAGALAAAALLLLMLATNYQERDESQNTAVSDFGKALLDGLPQVCKASSAYASPAPNRRSLCACAAQGALFLTLGDLPGNAARYHHYCENRRPDVDILDLEMMTFDW